MQLSKLKIFIFSLALISLFFGGLLGFCSVLSKDVHAAAFGEGHVSMAVIDKIPSTCCEAHVSKDSFIKQLGLSATENKNFGLGATFFSILILSALASFFVFTKRYLAAKIYYLRQSIASLSNYLLLAFSRGILNSKIY